MNTAMNLQRIPVEQLKPAQYNPRKDLKPGDPAYEKIRRSLSTFGYVDPVIWNEATGNIVGGHQRFKVLGRRGRDRDRLRGGAYRKTRRMKKHSTVALNKAVGGMGARGIGRSARRSAGFRL